jgi:hypothetical protein
MIKLIAAAITIVSGISIGTSLTKAENNQLKELEAFGDLIFCVYKGIESPSLPLEKIFGNYFKDNPDSPIYNKFHSTRGSYGEKLSYISSFICSEKLQSEIKDFSKTLGTLDRESQIISASNANDATKKEIAERRKEHITNCRLYKTISTLISCVIAVLLY